MLHLETEGDVRVATTALGVATALFGLWPVLAPRSFARVFGLPTQAEPTTGLSIRSVGIRDLVMGAGLVSAAVHGGRIAPWLLARLLIDSLDGAAVGLTLVSRQGRSRPLALLGLLAAGAAAIDGALWWAARVIVDPAPLDEF